MRSEFSLAKRPARRTESGQPGLYGHQTPRAGTKKLHAFTGERGQVDKPKSAPAQMKDKIRKQNNPYSPCNAVYVVHKVIIRLFDIELGSLVIRGVVI